MSKCCKYAKWWPHNWLCLKGLSVIFLVLFYVTLVYTIVLAYGFVTSPFIQGAEMWFAAALYTAASLATAIGFLTIAKILKALRKIKHAVAPCACSVEEKPAPSEIEKVVEKESK